MNESTTARYSDVMPLQYGIYVYRCWTVDDVCIYVGSTKNALRRLGAHALVSWWKSVHYVDVATMASQAEAQAEERAQIRRLKPINNTHYNRTWARKSSKPPPEKCPYDHPYDDANTLYNSKGSKICRTCKNGRARDVKPGRVITQDERQEPAPLSAAVAADIRRQRALSRTIESLADEYHVHPDVIQQVANGSRWTHVRADDVADTRKASGM